MICGTVYLSDYSFKKVLHVITADDYMVRSWQVYDRGKGFF